MARLTLVTDETRDNEIEAMVDRVGREEYFLVLREDPRLHEAILRIKAALESPAAHGIGQYIEHVGVVGVDESLPTAFGKLANTRCGHVHEHPVSIDMSGSQAEVERDVIHAAWRVVTAIVMCARAKDLTVDRIGNHANEKRWPLERDDWVSPA